jgi:hypothetical protein
MHLIDRDAMNKRIYFGNAKVATGPISSKNSKVQQILVEDVPVAWTLELEYPIIYDKAFKNIVTSGIGSHETFGSVYKS